MNLVWLLVSKNGSEGSRKRSTMGNMTKKGGQTPTATGDGGGIDAARKVLVGMKPALPAGSLATLLRGVSERLDKKVDGEAQRQVDAYKAETEAYVSGAIPKMEKAIDFMIQNVGQSVVAGVEVDLRALLEAAGDSNLSMRMYWIFGRIYVQKAQAAGLKLRDVIRELIINNCLRTLKKGEDDKYRIQVKGPDGKFTDGDEAKPGINRVTIGDFVYEPASRYPAEASADVRKVFDILQTLAGVTADKASVDRDVAMGKFEADLTGKAEDFWAGKKGIYALYVAESSYERTVRDAKGEEVLDEAGKAKFETIHLPGGRLKVALDENGKVEVIGGWGPFHKYVDGIARVSGVCVSLNAAKNTNFRIPGDVFKRMGDDARRATGALHRLLSRAYKAWLEWEAGDKAIKAFKVRGPLPAAEFFQGVIGVTYVYHKSFSLGGKEYEYAGVLVERASQGVRLVDSINAEGLFPEAAKEFAQEGEQFSGVPHPLNSFLRAAFGRVMAFDENTQTWQPRPKRDQTNGDQPKVDLPPAPVEATEPESAKDDEAQAA